MSGLEPLAALGLACNVLQVVEVGLQTINLIKVVYQGGSIDDALEQNAVILANISREVKKSKQPAKCPKHEQQLIAAAERCSTAARDLTEEIQFLVGSAKKGSLASTLKVVARTSWRRRRLERLKENLDSAEKLMNTGLLVRIWSSANTAELDLKKIKEDLRSFIVQFQNGHRNTSELVSRETIAIKEHVTSVSAQNAKSLEIARQSLDSLVLDASFHESQAKRDRLLQSLKYPGFNERRNQVAEAYKNTGTWIFAGDGDEIDSLEDRARSSSEDITSETSESQETRHNVQDYVSAIKWDSFSNWLRSTDTIYWISGKPGAGKTTLVKFIINHPDTQTFLKVWQPSPLIVSHFLWRPGTELQRSIKGLLCSLVQQLLENSTTVLDSILQCVPRVNMKDTDTDWSAEELRLLCLRVLSTYDRPICLFLDGLDEVDSRDGVVRLLNLVDEVAESANIKICLSSRPEPLLQRRLSIYPSLRLQDLNMGDLELYARDRVILPDGYVADRGRDDLIHSLVNKAEGVFLWLVLAVSSINRGAEYGDTIDLVDERIRQLPGDLIELYKDMWNRACKDDPLQYRQTAALYFKLLLIHREEDSAFERSFFGWDLFTFTLASTSTADEILQHGNRAPDLISEATILQRCQEVERKIGIYCFGLIELGPGQDYLGDEDTTVVGHYGDAFDKLLPLTGGKRVLRFMHRTAHDFLLDTADGRAILEFDTSSKISLEIRIVQAYLAGSQLFLHADYYVLDSASFATTPLYLMRYLRRVYQGTDSCMVLDWQQLIRRCESLCNDGKLFVGSRNQARLCKGEDFLKVAASICSDEYVLHAIKHGALSQQAKSEILLNACNAYASRRTYLRPQDLNVDESIRVLLREGADPKYKGFKFSPDLWLWPFAQLDTPFTDYLACRQIHRKNHGLKLESLVVMLETLRIFIDREANLDEMVTVVFLLGTWFDPCREDSLPGLHLFQVFELTRINPDFTFHTMEDSILFVSFPAHAVLDAFLNMIRLGNPPPAEETKLNGLLLSLETRCKNWCSSERSRFIGRVGRAAASLEEGGWFETTEDQQERITKLVISQALKSAWAIAKSSTIVMTASDDEDDVNNLFAAGDSKRTRPKVPRMKWLNKTSIIITSNKGKKPHGSESACILQDASDGAYFLDEAGDKSSYDLSHLE
ncbi:hypothetical protein PFICI_07851 [Pestalotiopsis fici W106-1]|uniref:Uncharacterized protein n=1 Tax=Pestalotiopsis fici (strain W106-1 / CGMCC3.15140) TaxID=1229662 RepID=W3X4L5_PESFW|nr:uncharacterized protein PFICI_07851 [Pestalotiopsis fici W106-1]ETS80322.1 hypothetical protein PFICI_07851 [Pestalotiopsis fici W106-1]